MKILTSAMLGAILGSSTLSLLTGGRGYLPVTLMCAIVGIASHFISIARGEP